MKKEQWDVQWCRPKVARYLEVQRHPNVVYMDWLETWLGRYCKVPHIIKTPRLRFCISQCLRDEGYHRGSKNGKRWEINPPEAGGGPDYRKSVDDLLTRLDVDHPRDQVPNDPVSYTKCHKMSQNVTRTDE